jgi:hypothetical protein
MHVLRPERRRDDHELRKMRGHAARVCRA